MTDATVYHPLLSNYDNDCEIDIDCINNASEERIPSEELCNSFILAHLDEITANIMSEEVLINNLFVQGDFKSSNTIDDHRGALLKAKRLLIKLAKDLPSDKKNSNNSMVIGSSLRRINVVLDKCDLLCPQNNTLIEKINKHTEIIRDQNNYLVIIFYLMLLLFTIVAVIIGLISCYAVYMLYQ